LVILSSVEDGSLGEEVQVLWEAEIGARCFEREQLPQPTAFDDPSRLDAFLDAVRWGVVSGADRRTFHAPFRSGIEIEDYQLDPLVRAVQMPRVNLLIADAVGLGKTIEAGLIVQELIFRNRVRTALIVCPASLQIQWREEMWDKFGLEFHIVDSALLKHLRRTRGLHANPWSHFPRLITSYAYLRRDRNLRLFQDLLPADGQPTYPRKFDLLICDEAHNLAPSGKGARNSQQTAAIQSIAPHFEHRLFLSATPHNGYTGTDLDLGHGFHETKQGVRYTIHEAARREVLGRLLKLNHERYAEEVAQGLHDKGKPKAGGKRGKKAGGEQGGDMRSVRRNLFDTQLSLGDVLE
jgi:SNF2 family DNA or RNA helicase